MKRICLFLSITGCIVSAFMLVPMICSEIYGDGCTAELFQALGVGVLATCALACAGRGAALKKMKMREAIIAVVLSWLLGGVLMSLPYHFTNVMPSYLDSLFEGISGVTTTGATVVPDFDSIPRCVMLWRSLSQWIGGVGIVVLALAFFPASGAGMQLFKAEVSGPVHERLTPRIQRTAMFLLKTYICLTAAQFALLYTIGGLDAFDSITLSLSTAATGGFSPYKDSVGHFNSNTVQLITAIFLFLAATNISLYHAVIVSRSLGPLKRNPEFKFFVGLVMCFGVLTASTLHYEGFCEDVGPALRDGFFHTVSMISTCGFFTQDYDMWPPSIRQLTLTLMVVGGCAASTAGGMTCVRVIIALKHAKKEFSRMLHPRGILPVRFTGRAVHSSVVSSSFAFIIAYLSILLFGFILLTMLGQDMMTAMSSAAATLSNVGPGMGMTGPTSSYAAQIAPAKVVCMFLMLAGRLEIFTLLVLFTRDLWRTDR